MLRCVSKRRCKGFSSTNLFFGNPSVARKSTVQSARSDNLRLRGNRRAAGNRTAAYRRQPTSTSKDTARSYPLRGESRYNALRDRIGNGAPWRVSRWKKCIERNLERRARDSKNSDGPRSKENSRSSSRASRKSIRSAASNNAARRHTVVGANPRHGAAASETALEIAKSMQLTIVPSMSRGIDCGEMFLG